MSQNLRSLSPLCRIYVLCVSAVGLAIAAHSLTELLIQPVSVQWLILAALTLLTGSFTVRIPKINARLSVSDTFVFASVLLFGPAAGTITVLLDALIISLRLKHPFREPFRVIFNVSLAALSTWVAAQVFFLVSGVPPYSIEQTPLGQVLFPLFLFTLTYFLLNTWLVTFALALEQGSPAYPIWRENFFWLAVNYFGGASVAGLLVTYTREIDFTTLGIIVPLLLISYLTFKTSMGRIEDANTHLLEVNRLYLSTIETLAMAIDAKDQITHGHIRRVQRLAVGLARTLGVTEETQLKAIEAAALLHDMGKLAIPEFILNKPGRLTPNEFDIMKQHANIGADILGSIRFPYPVVPIVRHHHESWDGAGYPDRLKGVAIPLGARILSVVDCFDALTSDRPYRPRLSVQDAITVLLQRRGSMYDPLVVDTFIEAQQALSALAADNDADRTALDSIATKLRIAPEPSSPPVTDTHQRLPLKVLSLLRAVRPSPAGMSVEGFGLIVSNQLSRLTKYSAIAIYCVSENEQTIRCRYAGGTLATTGELPEIALGERLSGWVAAHRTAIWNSDATLDLPAEVAHAASVTLGSSVPLLDGDILIGTLTLYSTAGVEIPIEQRVLIQAITPLLATALSAAIAHDGIAAIDGRGLDDREALYSVLDALISTRSQLDIQHHERPTIVRISWPPSGLSDDPSSIDAILQQALAAATNGTGHLIRLAPNEVLLATTHGALLASGLAPSTTSSGSGQTHFQVTEVANSLQLRELLGLTHHGGPLTAPTRPSVH